MSAVLVKILGPWAGIEEHFALISIAQLPNLSDGYGLLPGPALPIPSGIIPGNSCSASAALAVSVNQMAGPVEIVNRVISDDERSEQRFPLPFRKPPLLQRPAQVQPVQQKATALCNCPSSDSVAKYELAFPFTIKFAPLMILYRALRFLSIVTFLYT